MTARQQRKAQSMNAIRRFEAWLWSLVRRQVTRDKLNNPKGYTSFEGPGSEDDEPKPPIVWGTLDAQGNPGGTMGAAQRAGNMFTGTENVQQMVNKAVAQTQAAERAQDERDGITRREHVYFADEPAPPEYLWLWDDDEHQTQCFQKPDGTEVLFVGGVKRYNEHMVAGPAAWACCLGVYA